MISFIDLKSQYQRLEKNIDEAIKRVLDHGEYILGPEVGILEKRLAAFAGSKHGLGCSNGTDALLLALMALEIGGGDAVFTSPFTFFATGEAIAMLGATPIFVDIDADTYNINPELLEKSIIAVKAAGKLRPRAIMSVDIFGLCADYQAIGEISARHNLPVIQDAAQSFGAEFGGKRAPSHGLIGCTSFFPAKPLGCYGDGGAVFTDDDRLNQAMRSIMVHGKGTDKYDNIRIGMNARLDTIQAAILIEKLNVFPEEIEQRQRVAAAYMTHLDGLVKLPVIPSGYKSVWAQFCVRAANFAEIQDKLKASGIPTARYYPVPLHRQKAFAYLNYGEGSLPVSEQMSKDIFALPMHPYLEEETIKQIAAVIRSCR